MRRSDESTPFLGFYEQRGIIPVRQDDHDLEAHMLRRQSLYRQIGITPNNIRGRRIIEFGPGTGDNAIYLASQNPSRLVLVDGNLSSVAAINERLVGGRLGPNCEVQQEEILSYKSSEKFDVVICEGTIPGQADPIAFLRHVAGFADSDGIVLITSASAESCLAEICRRVVSSFLIRDNHDSDAALEFLTSYFGRDLDSLPGMSRRHDDWVLDNIIHPWTKRGELLSVDMAIRALSKEFSFLSSSPRMVQDWRWFKSMSQDPLENAEIVIAEYQRWSTYLLDYRSAPTNSSAEVGKQVANISRAVFDVEKASPDSRTREDYLSFMSSLELLIPAVEGFMPQTQVSVRSFIAGLTLLIDQGGPSDRTDMAFADFRPWFGRGQQYLSFLRF